MSTDRTKLLFEGFLQKRKDTMKIRWVTYWFRLQNTTLFFYTKKNGSALHLRGNYYIYTVQSVREVQHVNNKRFLFEIVMTNGKRKMLAAESAADRKEWVGHLWRAMRLSSCGASEPENTKPEEKVHSSTRWCSHSGNVTSPDPSRCEQTASSPHLYEQVNEEPTYQNTVEACEYQRHHDARINGTHCALDKAEDEDGDYDVLPLGNRKCEPSEDVYDFPASYWRAANHQDPDESIYDVPSCLLRKMCDHTLDERPEEMSLMEGERCSLTSESPYLSL